MKKGLVKLVLGLACIGTCLTGAVFFMTKNQSRQFIKADTKEEAAEWTERLVELVPDLPAIINGAQPTAESHATLKFLWHSNGVGHFELYDLAGKRSFISDQLGDLRPTDTPPADSGAEVAQALQSGNGFVELNTEIDGSESKTVTKTFMPIEHDGKMIGVAEVDMDKSDIAAALLQKFTFATLLASGLTALGFAVPAAAVMLQMRRRREADEQVMFLANHDSLTNLPNRRHAEGKLQNLIDEAGKDGSLMAIHFIDIDFFKDINDRHGHSFGDELLKSFAERLNAHAKDGGFVARFGGDEFLVVQPGLASPDELGLETRKLMNTLSLPYNIMGKVVVATASVGTSIFPVNGIKAESLLTNADTALYAVKLRGRNGHSFFDPDFMERKKRRADIEALIRKHTAARSFELHYQPLHKLDDGALRSFEALLRMQSDDGTQIPPAEFIPIAEDIGVIDEIGGWVIQEACRQARDWPEHIKIAVNLSAVQFRRKSVVAAVKQALHKTGLDPRRLLLEVTESLLMSDVEGVLEQLSALKTMGVRLAMDDFGTGYSSLSYMVRFPFDRIKIDRSFVKQLEQLDPKARQVVQTIVTLGHNMGMAVTAEGVETEAQVAELHGMKCDDAQGFFYSKPVPATEVASLILKDFAQRQAASAEPFRRPAVVAAS